VTGLSGGGPWRSARTSSDRQRHAARQAARSFTPPSCKEGQDELARPSSALFWLGLAAGLSMGFSLITEGLLRTYLPEASWQLLVSKLGYRVGFLIVILGRRSWLC
jgi:formate/nitrite transporter FocA (FNT family)